MQFYRSLCLILGVYISCTLISHAQFIKSTFQFESEIVGIIQIENQRIVATATNGLYVSEDDGKSWSRRWLPRWFNPMVWDGFY
jgi:hypothetical protein